jgi:hypothetical protein
MTAGFSIKYKGPDLDALAAELEAPVRPAAQAMTQVFYDRVVANVGGIRKKTGNLARSIYQAYSKDNSSPTRAVYHVSWNARQAPHGHLVEFGHLMRYEVSFDPETKRFTTHKDRPLAAPKHVAARPFLRPALSYTQQALDAGEARYLAELKAKGVTK